METPMDVLNHRLGKIRDNGDIDFDNTAAAIDIDEELQEKFVFIPQEEIDAVEIVDRGEEAIQQWRAGDGPEAIRASRGDNPDWLYNSAVNALAMYRHLLRVEEQEKERAKLDARPAPGMYLLEAHKCGIRHLCVVTEDRRIMVQTDTDRTKFQDRSQTYDGLAHKSVWEFTPLDLGTQP